MSRGGSRPGAGRKRTDPALKDLRGTARKDRGGSDGTPMAPGAMIAPIHLSSDLAQLIFGSIAQVLQEQGRASPHYTETVALLAQRLEQVQRFQAVLECAGDTYESKTASGIIIRKRPEVAMLSDAMRHAHSLLGELMLTPATAMRLSEGQAPVDNPFAAFLEQN